MKWQDNAKVFHVTLEKLLEFVDDEEKKEAGNFFDRKHLAGFSTEPFHSYTV